MAAPPHIPLTRDVNADIWVEGRETRCRGGGVKFY